MTSCRSLLASPLRAQARPTYGGRGGLVQRCGILAALAAAFLGLAATCGPASAAAVKIVALGDSLTAGYGLPAASAFAQQLQAAMRARGDTVEITNAGVSGDTADDGLARLDWSVPDDTDAVILELGANDALRGVDPARPRQALDEILGRLQARHIKVLLCGMRAPPNLGQDYTRAFNAVFPELAAKHKVPLYPFFLDGVAANPKLTLPDGMHPTAEGVAIIVQKIIPQAEELVAQVRARP
jgi:acyl-CoA thioesterase-1